MFCYNLDSSGLEKGNTGLFYVFLFLFLRFFFSNLLCFFVCFFFSSNLSYVHSYFWVVVHHKHIRPGTFIAIAVKRYDTL